MVAIQEPAAAQGLVTAAVLALDVDAALGLKAAVLRLNMAAV